MDFRIPPGRAWKALARHYESIRGMQMRDLFSQDPTRAGRYSIESGPLYLDYSKNRITDETLALLTNLVFEYSLEAAIENLFSGRIVNFTEKRAALHSALRADPKIADPDPTVSQSVHTELTRMAALHARLVNGELLGYSNRPVDTVVNIGIGGSDLGPRLVTEAMAFETPNDVKLHFIANIDPSEARLVLRNCRPETTLFIISSKSFTTLETRKNAKAVETWLRDNGCPSARVPDHFLVATSNSEAALQAGLKPENIYHFWDWVGGRYSVWSAAGLAAFLALGPTRFESFLQGARQMDQHFREAPADANMPIILALIGIWYINFFNAASHAIVPYDQRLRLLPDYLCQLVMESNGKSVTAMGGPISWDTAPVTWGGVGTNVQHSFFQALHQGTRLIPLDFILPLRSCPDVDDVDDVDEQQAALFASCLAQSRALMVGSEPTDRCPEEPHLFYPGNRPSNTIVYEELTSEALGALLALYEHKTYVQAVLWQINPFDQWGVELGKRITKELLQSIIDDSGAEKVMDSSTRTLLQRHLLQRYKHKAD